MTPATPQVPAEPNITIEDLKHRVETVRDLAVTEAKQTVDKVVDENATRTLLVMAGIVVLAASVAFYLGSRVVAQRSSDF